MERYSSRTIDELGRIVLHSELREKLSLEVDDKIYLKVVDTLLVLQKLNGCSESGCFVCQVDALGRMGLCSELLTKLSWQTGDKIAVYHTDNLLILKSA